jgi:hypothetical protein
MVASAKAFKFMWDAHIWNFESTWKKQMQAMMCKYHESWFMVDKFASIFLKI